MRKTLPNKTHNQEAISNQGWNFKLSVLKLTNPVGREVFKKHTDYFTVEF